ncbi:ferredoxin oxidoreductase [Nautilia sp. PV-1]|uniref:2-oxoacid:acceptor oxidoreductase family protein n=1 Tax=Nautilia sp. PV-1 TaxID=2579250 RepID=UPI000FDC2354|nr:2-oxoacid:acceptor oxidoreductase family protein [Nautilia sp. PV-1]AZV46679.1 ferredoxin oxidoreductase [Nautilia sp. PV-1]
MRYQIVVAGFGGQGVVFLVKVLSICAGKKGYKFLGTENHGMSQRGGSVSSHIKIGDFYNPLIDLAQADLLIGLDKDEAILNLPYLKRGGNVVVNADEFPEIDANVFAVDANELAEEGVFDAKGLNVFMLGLTLARVKDFPFSIDEVKAAIEEINPKFAPQNFDILEKALEYGKN